MQQKVAVSGASGFVGKAVCRAFAEKGFKVIALVRSKESAKKLGHKNISPVIADIFSPKKLSRHLKNCVVFFHFIGSSKKTRDTFYEKLNIESTKSALLACKKAGVKKFVYLSGLGVSSLNNQAYFLSKRLAENEIKKSGIDYTVFRPSYIIGKQSTFMSQIRRQAGHGGIFVPGTGNYRLQPILVDDFAQISLKIPGNKKARKKTFDLVGPKIVSFKQFCRLVCRILGLKPRLKFVPLEKEIRQAMFSKNPPYSVGELTVLVSDTFSSHKPLEKAFSLKLTSLEKTLQQVFF